MKKEELKKTDNLLYFSVFILAIISAYTTAEGFMLVWNTTNFIGMIIAWAFAIAVSSFLVFASLKVSEYLRQGKAAALIFTFFLFAMISMFFNFNSIYGKFVTKDIYIDELKQIKVKLAGLEVNGLNAVDEFYGFSKYEKKVDSLGKKADAENTNVLRPGKWVRYQGFVDQKTDASAQFAQAKEKYTEVKNKFSSELTKLNAKIDSTILLVKEKDYAIVLDESFGKYNELGMIVKNINPKYDFKPATRTSNAGKPDFALQSLVKFFSGDETLTSKERVSIVLASLLSFLLDFPLFIALVILHMPRKRKNTNDIFGDSENNYQQNNDNRPAKKILWD
jgi:hypothetical protein